MMKTTAACFSRLLTAILPGARSHRLRGSRAATRICGGIAADGQPLKEGEPLVSDRVCLQQIEQRL